MHNTKFLLFHIKQSTPAYNNTYCRIFLVQNPAILNLLSGDSSSFISIVLYDLPSWEKQTQAGDGDHCFYKFFWNSVTVFLYVQNDVHHVNAI